MGAADERRLTIDPPPTRWRPADPRRPGAQRTRAELGLPADVSIIMTGHQPTLWHAGILAKYLAADAAAATRGARTAWVTAEDDPAPAPALAYPARAPNGGLVRREIDLAARPTSPPDDAATDAVRAGIATILAAWRATEGVSPPARRAEALAHSLLSGLVEPAPSIRAPDLARTTLLRRVVGAMADDPLSCARAYNAAAAAVPRAQVRPLEIDSDRVELPLWRGEGEGRERVFARVGGGRDALGPIDALTPRALLLTGLLRAGACDLFVHGTGGGDPEHGYDRVTERWHAAWLARAADSPVLAPSVMVTATVRLPLRTGGAPTPTEIDRAVWRHHHARHTPSLVGGEDAQREKDRLVRAIAAAKHAGDDPAPLFEAMHALLGRVRAEGASRLDAMAREASALDARRREAAIADDRAWPFPLHGEAALRALRDEVRAAFAER